MATPVRDREAVDQAVVRGSDLLKQGKLDDAIRAFHGALELDPENTKVLALLGLCLFRGNQFAAARPIYEQLVELASTDASHRLNLGLVYLKLGEGELAIHALEASRALDPSQGRAVSYLGLAYARGGRYAEAYRSFLIAGQNELASEIEINLTQAERDGIHSQLGRTPRGPFPEPAKTTGQIPVAKTSQPMPVAAASPTPAPAPAPAPVVATEPPARPSAKNLGIGDAELSSPEIVIERPVETPAPARMTDSQIFVLPKTESAVPDQRPGDMSMVSMAVSALEPARVAGPQTPSGGTGPRPLSELATEALVRPDEGDDAFELAVSGALVIRVKEKMWTRLDGVHVTGGDLAFEAATRRSRGHQTDEKFDFGGVPLHLVTGLGYLIATPGEAVFAAVALDDDILYLREDLVFAFEGALRWENGNVPGLRGKLPVVQFRGDGALVVRSHAPLVRVKLPAQGIVYVDADRIAGWIGRVIPRAVVPPKGGPMGAMCVECTGEGVVLVEPAPKAPPRVLAPIEIAAPARPTPPPPPPPRELAPELADFAKSLLDDAPAAEDASGGPGGPGTETDPDAPPGRDEI